MKQALIVGLIVCLLLSACSSNRQVELDLPASTGADDLLPEMNEYSEADADEVVRTITNSGRALAVAGGISIPAAEVADAIADFVACLDEKGAAVKGIYYDNENPLSVGVVAIVDKNEISNPLVLGQCIVKASGPLSVAGEYEYRLCFDKYTVVTETNKFYFVYAGTTTNVCEDLCTDLQGCK